MAYSIVPIAEEHIESFHAAVDSVARERRYLAMPEAYPLEQTRAFVRGNIVSGEVQFVALADDAVVGWCDILRKPAKLVRHGGVLGMGVVAGHRGRGIGRSLIEAALAAARASGLTRVELTVWVENERARRLYEKVGFEIEGRLRNNVLVEGDYRDSWLMAVIY